MAEGFRRAGLPLDVAIDADTDACDSYEKNLGHRPIRMDVRDFLRLCESGLVPCVHDWIDSPLELIVADPPCTPWSRAGKRLGTRDERDMITQTVTIISLLRPSCYLIGNVPGLNDSTQWPTIQRQLERLRSIGYCTADYISLDAAAYGVPQHRIRPFWFGHLAGPCIDWPDPTHADPRFATQPQLPGVQRLEPWVTCRQALAVLKPEEMGRPVRVRAAKKSDAQSQRIGELDEPDTGVPRGGMGACHVIRANSRHMPASLDKPAPTVGAKQRGQSSEVVFTEHVREDGSSREHAIDEPAKAITKRADGQRVIAERAPDENHPPASPDEPHRTITAAGRGEQALMEWPWNRPATTVTADDRLPQPGHHDEVNYRIMANAIVLSETAAKLLQGFPREWNFCGKTKKSRFSQLGQAMPPPLAEAVARAIKRQMEKTRSEEARTCRTRGA